MYGANHPVVSFWKPRRRPAFTLNELLIVVAILVLVVSLALPAFNAMTGSRSLESAENRVSAYIGAARSEAIGLQEPRGVILFEDEGTRVIHMAQVYFPPGQNVSAVAALRLELFGARDEVALPAGVGMQGVPSGGSKTTTWPPFAVILFDGDGRLTQDSFYIASGNAKGSPLFGNTLADRLPTTGPNAIDVAANAFNVKVSIPANVGLVLFDKSAYEDQQSPALQKSYLQANAVPYLINRYGGTLMRAE